MRSAALVLVLAALLRVAPSMAQTEDALAAARQLFAEALADEDAGRYETALDKFRRVSAVRETANVRYRIAGCLDALGRHAEALASYEATVRLGAQDPTAADAVLAARSRAAQLDPVVSRLDVVIPPDAPAGTEVRIDDTVETPEALAAPVLLDAGHHTLRATAPSRAPFETAIVLQPGGRVSITVVLPSSAGAAGPEVPRDSSPAGPPMAAWIVVGAGAVLTVGSAVALALRASNLATLSRDCVTESSGSLSCPDSSRSEVDSAHDAAKIEGPLGIGLAAGAVAALGVGIVWILSSPSSGVRSVVVSPAIKGDGGVLSIKGTFGL
jgi:hypothetical protein